MTAHASNPARRLIAMICAVLAWASVVAAAPVVAAASGASVVPSSVSSSVSSQVSPPVVAETPSPVITLQDVPVTADFPAAEGYLQSIRAHGDLAAQRRHVWQLLAALTRPADSAGLPVFLTWYGSGEVFDVQAPGRSPGKPRDLSHVFSIRPAAVNASGESGVAPRLTRVHYNPAAQGHIRANGLLHAGILAQQASEVPAFPRNAVVVKTVWWPVPATGVVALPVWDAGSNPARPSGNDYPTWPRVVGISSGTAQAGPMGLDFMGRRFAAVPVVGLNAFFHISVDASLASSLMSDAESRRLALIALGRPLQRGDALALVALHVATRELADWVWGTVWWHDHPGQGPFAADRPASRPPWQNYLMDVSFDRDLPHESDGSPHVAFNPWLEARFADGGHGSGVVSNCMTCHERASTAVDRPFTVSRGSAPLEAMPRLSGSDGNALLPGNGPGGAPVTEASRAPVRTSFLWSIPMQAR